MAAPQLTGRKITSGLERAAYTIREFCDAHRISKCPSENILNPLNPL